MEKENEEENYVAYEVIQEKGWGVEGVSGNVEEHSQKVHG